MTDNFKYGEETSIENTGEKRANFSGGLGYILAVAGSAVGLGNIWRFPYLAAKYGGGMFLLTYLILTLTFGYAMIMSETTIGRMTKRSAIGAFNYFGNSKILKVGGFINAIVPVLIVPYYSVIGGWVVKYLVEYIKGNVDGLAADGYFGSFIGDTKVVFFWFVIFALATFVVILGGVEQGIERVSKIMMPLLIILAIVVALYSVTRPGAMAGVKYFFVPNFHNFSLMTVVAALGQMFYSLSIAMGILYTYGSYLTKDVDVEISTSRVEMGDTGGAVHAGLMVIPAVFAFSGGDPDKLKAGPSLMFITLPKVFESMGAGRIAGIGFFLLVLLAALTSAISLVETSISTFCDELNLSRNKSVILMAVIMVFVGGSSAAGYGILDFVKIFKMPILDFLDFLTNSIMMPIAALATCYLVVRIITLKKIAAEISYSSAFKRKSMYNIVMRVFAPVFLIIILVSAILNTLGVISL